MYLPVTDKLREAPRLNYGHTLTQIASQEDEEPHRSKV